MRVREGSVTPLGALGAGHFKKKFGLDRGLRVTGQADVLGRGSSGSERTWEEDRGVWARVRVRCVWYVLCAAKAGEG